MSARVWTPDPTAIFHRRLGIAPTAPGSGRDPDTTGTGGESGCPDIWELDNGDVAVIGRDLTAHYSDQLPAGVSVGPGESLVIIPKGMARAAKKDIPDA